MKISEIPLDGGRSTETVVRIGDRVHRSMMDNAPFVHSFLKHLSKEGFSYSPRFLGIDDKGREILSFIKGEVPLGVVFSDQQLISCMKILRTLHDIASLSDLCNGKETICHNDFSPWNIIFQNERPVGIIDFDEAEPGSRIDDVAYFLWTFLDLGNQKISDDIQINRIGLLCKTYGLDKHENIVKAIFRQQERILEFRKERALNEVDEEKRVFSANKVNQIEQEIDWVKRNAKVIRFS